MSGTRVSRLCFVALAACGLGVACTTTGTNKERIEPTFINVSLAGDLATPEAPLPFTVEPQAAVGEFHVGVGRVFVQQLPEDARGQAAHQVFAVDEDAVVAAIESDFDVGGR